VAARASTPACTTNAAGRMPAGEVLGNVSAVDLRTGRIRWQRRTDTPPISTGALATAGGLVFYGDGSLLVALDAATGRALRKLETGCPIDGTPVIFSRAHAHRLRPRDSLGRA
jgi:outer membrane protein assembly factor BamB